MASNAKSVPLGSQKATWREKEHPTYYANMLAFAMSPFDITLLFGEIESADTTQVFGTPRVKVILAPEQAQNLIQILSIAVQSFTEANGALRASGSVNVADLKDQLAKKLIRQ